MKFNNKKLSLVVVMLVIIMTFTGCVDVYDLTDKEANIVADYSTFAVMRHTRYKKDLIASKREIAKYEAKLEEKAKRKEAQSEEEKAKEEKKDDKSKTDSKDTKTDDKSKDTASKSSATKAEHGTALGLSGISVAYKDYEVTDSYVMDGLFAINPKKGNKLFVMNFTVTNSSGADAECNVVGVKPKYTLNINGKMNVQATNTILPNDLSMYVKTLTAGESKDVVLIFEGAASAFENISSLSLDVSVGGTTYNVGV